VPDTDDWRESARDVRTMNGYEVLKAVAANLATLDGITRIYCPKHTATLIADPPADFKMNVSLWIADQAHFSCIMEIS
jgi:hypothetical protein